MRHRVGPIIKYDFNLGGYRLQFFESNASTKSRIVRYELFDIITFGSIHVVICS